MNHNKEEILNDYKIARESREASLFGRKEVLRGRGSFGIFGDGKEIAQIAMAKVFRNGDFRSGYYRDQTFMFASGLLTLKQFFATIYGDTDISHEPASAGRSMNNHFATRLLDPKGVWLDLMKQKNSSSDISPTAAQMPRLLGLAYASKLYRNNPDLKHLKKFSNNGNEVAFGTIGNASTAEGIFFETINAAGVLMVPLAISIWDDGFGISVPNIYQITKSDISEILKGFEYNEKLERGFLIYTVPGWNYPELVKAYKEGIAVVREKHIPAIYHITEMTQPLGHSTSGSHERYKTKKRLEWEAEYDCIKQMRKWIIESGITNENELYEIENNAKQLVKKSSQESWDEFIAPIKNEKKEIVKIFLQISSESKFNDIIKRKTKDLENSIENNRKENFEYIDDILKIIKNENIPSKKLLLNYKNKCENENYERYNTYLNSSSVLNALNVKEIKPLYTEKSPVVNGREIILAFFDEALKRIPELFAIGEDIGQLGDVNQGMAGLQAKYGDLRITDTGIREATIAGQGIGTAMRGLRPVIEIQYLDYLLYALQILSDDLASLQYRTRGGQKSPVIIRTRGHRLEGIWHSGSPMGMIINSLRGIYVCVPRNMTKAAGFYNTLLKSDEPGLIIERLNAYRLKEKMPDNISDITTPLGIPEIIKEGSDLTIVTYGACVDIALKAISDLEKFNISCELIDVQTLIPFDINSVILQSLKKTNKILFLDEDVPGGASAYMFQQVIEKQNGYRYLDSPPKTLTAKPHRPAYSTDGDYFSKPNAEDIFKAVYEIMHESNPSSYPLFY